jgi:hypothetical protein
MFSFVVSHTRDVEQASTFEWFTYAGRPLVTANIVLHKGQRFGVRRSPCGSHVQMLTFGATKIHNIDDKLARKLAKNIAQ